MALLIIDLFCTAHGTYEIVTPDIKLFTYALCCQTDNTRSHSAQTDLRPLCRATMGVAYVHTKYESFIENNAKGHEYW